MRLHDRPVVGAGVSWFSGIGEGRCGAGVRRCRRAARIGERRRLPVRWRRHHRRARVGSPGRRQALEWSGTDVLCDEQQVVRSLRGMRPSGKAPHPGDGQRRRTCDTGARPAIHHASSTRRSRARSDERDDRAAAACRDSTTAGRRVVAAVRVDGHQFDAPMAATRSACPQADGCVHRACAVMNRNSVARCRSCRREVDAWVPKR